MSQNQEIAFGTSGLRGPDGGFTAQKIAAFTQSFLSVCCERASQKTLIVGMDLRASSPMIAGRVCAAARGFGWAVQFAGVVPTPALAAYGMARSLPAIMVTGSHIPAGSNGLKFYRPEGEMLKADEAPVREAAQHLLHDQAPANTELPVIDPAILSDYEARYCAAFPSDALAGLRIGIYAHSGVARDILPKILGALGAECIEFGRSDAFVAVDTEALSKEQITAIKTFMSDTAVDAVISTDGDGDRPLLIDEGGAQIPGDVLGALTARALGLNGIVTPLTSTSGIELSGWFSSVIRTPVGSPYVVDALQTVAGDAAGFEANGGFLLASTIDAGAGPLSPLATRDALLPLIAVLAAARRQSISLSQLASQMPKRFMRAGRVRPVAPEIAAPYLDEIARSEVARAALDPSIITPKKIETLDGVRMSLTNGDIVHLRQSGNAPEMRCYVETADGARSARMVETLSAGLSRHFEIENNR